MSSKQFGSLGVLGALPRLRESYRKAFHIQEIEQTPALQWVYYALIVGFVMAFGYWHLHPVGTFQNLEMHAFICPDYFQNCHRLYFLNVYPGGYSYSLFFAVIFSFLAGSVVSAVQKNWVRAHVLILPPFVAKILFGYFLTGARSVPFLTYHLSICFLFLFAKNKLQNARVLFVVLYAIAGVLKIHGGWIAGTYFSNIVLGLPYVPEALIPFATNLIMIMEIGLSWLLLCHYRKLWRIPFFLFLFFHLYSFLLVGFRYPLHCIPVLLALFYKPIETPQRLTGLGIGAIAALLLTNAIQYCLPGDTKLTQEGTSLSMNMFDANRQTRSFQKEHLPDGEVKTTYTGNQNAYNRISAYQIWYGIKKKCEAGLVKQVEWQLDVSINGSPFYRIVDEPDACALSYRFLAHNSWIRLEPAQQGYPALSYYNGYGVSFRSPAALSKPMDSKTGPQRFLEEHLKIFEWFYVLLAAISPLALLTWNRRIRERY